MITVVGSLNMDLVVHTKNVPAIGETILGDDFFTFPGGKGANQAVAAARLAGDVTMVGKVGDDLYGNTLIQTLKDEGIHSSYVHVTDQAKSGVAMITVTNQDNSIIVAPGANYAWNREEAETFRDVIQQSTIVVFQLETPLPFIEEMISIAHYENVDIILNPAPAVQLSSRILEQATYITPNETECDILFGVSPEEAVRNYPNKVIVTLGKNGAMYCNGHSVVRIAGFDTEAVDSTGAGDTFNGALAVALTDQLPLNEALEFANAAASLSVEKHGAQQGMPTREEVHKRLSS
ncbi:ribokinase [Geomicrobium sp. JCM 19038]|uniref:ribokinase n=1 Tax=Geomicrobium sp. JCM 19038 TaxID=1460635 RepID=UPI00045F4AE0|nr:ribokinase [Geomicrobium sp. JCM 19038]GAK07934.1 ribokinase [Geomicrobium sp. JCM 19038]